MAFGRMNLGAGFGKEGAGNPYPPPPPSGFVYLLGADGAYLKGADGLYLLGVAP